MSKISIKDIAQKANVSVGTVDRVLHNRGRVSPAALEKVNKAIQELDYSPNLIARSLATKQNYKIAVLIPSPRIDSFWEKPLIGIRKAETFIKDYGFTIDIFPFDDRTTEDISTIGPDIYNSNYQAILVAPTIKEEFHLFFEACEERHIPYVQINTFLPRKESQFLSYIGQDSYSSGKLAAKLLDFTVKEGDTLLILHLEQEVYNSEHLIQKEKGFRDYFKSKNKHDIKIEQQSFSEVKSKSKKQNFIKYILELYTNLAGVFVTTSKLHLVIDEFMKYGSDDLKFVGFDLIDENLKYLRSGDITFLINQNPIQQGYLAMMQIFNFLLKKESFKKVLHLPLDVVMEENVEYYLEEKTETIMVT